MFLILLFTFILSRSILQVQKFVKRNMRFHKHIILTVNYLLSIYLERSNSHFSALPLVRQKNQTLVFRMKLLQLLE